MRSGVSAPNFGDPGHLVELAVLAEARGWDGFFLWDHILHGLDDEIPIADPWVVLGAAANATNRIRLGTLITPVARRRPQVLAREACTLDHLSGGRAVLGVGLGWPADADFAAFGDEADERRRARMLDEGLDVIAGLWSGRSVSFDGAHYRVRGVTALPPPVQRPRIPVWVACTWPNRGPLRRAARWDGVAPIKIGPEGAESMTPEEVGQVAEEIRRRRVDDRPFDLLYYDAGPVRGRDMSEAREELAAAGATWWIDSSPGLPGWEDELRALVNRGPPT